MHKRVLYLAVPGLLSCLTLCAQPAPVITPGGTVNAADYSRDFAPGAIISVFGTNLAATTGGPSVVPLPTSLAGSSVELVSGSTVTALPVFYISPGQINAELPYGIPLGPAQIRVRTAAGASVVDNINVVARAPKLFSLNFSGKGSAVISDQRFNIVTQGSPVRPGDNILLWMNSLGETTPAVTAGSAAPGSVAGTSPALISGVSVTIAGKPAQVTFAGAAPGFSGLYQVNVRAPFLVITGPLDIQVSVAGLTTQAAVSLPYRQLGFYKAVLGGKPVAGQALSGAATLAFRQSDQIAWGTAGLNAWVHPAQAPPLDSTVVGEAITLRNGGSTVYDNNGIEDGSGATFYANAGGGPDSQKPGLANLQSQSNYFPLIFSGYMRLAQTTPVSEMIGYFDSNGELPLPFDPTNAFIKYRMNIWSNSGGLPKETGSYVGDVFSSDSTAGTFSVSPTTVSRTSSVISPTSGPELLWRLSFKPTAAVTLPAGEYWFSHDASIRETPSSGTSTSASVTASELAEIIRMQPQSGRKVNFSFFGREMLYQESWILPFAVEVRPDSPITTKTFSASSGAVQ
ncbi:MAG: hypothetical protein M3Z32_09305 [Acidobacteriota bacterium]|nr:hypothetical protein [Acidobacteriota bacterium]